MSLYRYFTLAALLFATPVLALDYYWTGSGTANADGNKEWNNLNNWLIGASTVGGGGVLPTVGEGGPSLSTDTVYDNVFLNNSGTSYLSGIATTSSYQYLNHLTIVGGSNTLGGRYSSNPLDLRVNGNFEIQSGNLFLGAYSPNLANFYGTFTAANGTTLGNGGSTSDGGHWDLTGVTAINFNGVTLREMTNNWQWSPQAWSFGTATMTLTNNNTFNLVQDVVNPSRTTTTGGVTTVNTDSRGSQQITINNKITGTGGITKTGDATLNLNNSTSDFSGATIINGGILSVAGGNAIGDTSAVTLANVEGGVNGGSVKTTLVLNANETIGSLAGGGTTGGNVILKGNTFTVGANNSSTTFAGVIAGSSTGATQATLANQAGPPAYAPSTAVGYNYAPLPVSGTGALVKTGTGVLTLTNANLYTSGTTIEQGTLFAKNLTGSATGSGAVTVKSGAILGGNGFIVTDANNSITIESGGILSVGDSSSVAQVLTVTPGTGAMLDLQGTLKIDLTGGAGSGGLVGDKLVVNGALNLLGNLDVSSSLSGYAYGDTWDLLDWTGVAPTGTFSNIPAGSLTGTFAGLPSLTTGLLWDVSRLYTTGQISIVPEPGRAVLLTFALIVGIFHRRRRHV